MMVILIYLTLSTSPMFTVHNDKTRGTTMKNKSKWYPLLLLGFVLLLASSFIASGCPAPAATPSPAPPPTPPLAPPTIAASPLMVIGFSAEQGVPGPLSQTLEIRNSGGGRLDWSVTDDADWLTLSPTTGSGSAGETNDIAVVVDASAMSAGDYTATITISAPEASNNPQEVLVNLTITPIIPTVSYSVSVVVSPGSQTGLPGDSLDYSVTITNRGTEADTYDLSFRDDHGWTLTAPSATSQIASVRSEVITLSLTIPADAVPETEDKITIIATSQNDSTTIGSATCTAVVIEEEEEEEEEQPPPTTPVSVSIIPSSVTISPGDTFTIEVVIDSAGIPITASNVVVTFDADLTVTGVTGADLLGTSGLDALYIPTIDVGEVSYGGVRIDGPIAVNGNFVTINFEVDAAAAGTYELILDATLRDANGDPIAVVENDSQVIVQ